MRRFQDLIWAAVGFAFGLLCICVCLYLAAAFLRETF